MTLPTYYATGTASVNNGATTITFAGALLGSAELPTFKPGDLFFDPAQPLVPGQRLADVDYGAGTAELWVGWPGASMTADPYEVRFVDDSVRSTAQTRRLLEQLSVVQANGRGLFYRFSATTADADPGEGHLRLNHATIASATAAYVDNADANGAAVQAVLDTWDDGGAVGGRGQLWLRSVAAPATFHAFNLTGSVVDGTGYRKLTLAYVGGTGSLSADDELMVDFVRSGAAGAPGASGSNGVGVPAGGALGQVLKKVSSADYDTAWQAGGGGAWLDVVSFGATGDGSTNDAPMIMNAVAVADTVEGGGIFFSAPVSHYQLSSAITLDGTHPVTLLGVGQPELRSDFAGAAISVGTGPGTEQGFVTLKDFKLWGDAGSVTGIRGQFAVNLLLDGLSLYQIGTMGAYLSNCYSFLMDRCQFNECGDAGLHVTKASMNRGVISRSKFVNHGGANQCGISIAADGSMHHGGLITGCDFEFNTNGIKCADISGLHIADCYFEENDFHILAETTCDHIKITDCQFLGPGVVDLSDVDGVTLDNLVFYGTGTVLDLTGCTKVRLGRLEFPNGGTIAGLANYISIGGPSAPVVDAMGDLGSKAQVRLRTMFNAPNGGGSIALYHNNALGALPANGDRLGFVIGGSNDGGNDRNGGALIFYAADNWSSTSLPTRLALELAAAGSTARSSVLEAFGTGRRLVINGSLGTGVPVSKTADFAVADTENDVINNKGSTCVVTLPPAATYPGRVLWCMNEVAQAMNSASSNVVPKIGGAAGTAILPATDGAWARLKSDGANWKITASGT